MPEAQNGGDEYSISREREKNRKILNKKFLISFFFSSFTPKTGLFIIEFAFFSRC
jgi:hypothetical protein